VLEEGEVDSKSNLYMAALAGGEKPFGLAHLDLSTGEFRVTEIEEWEEVLDELRRIKPAELLLLDKDAWLFERGSPPFVSRS
jgi:DNA mismatch repair protein MutS